LTIKDLNKQNDMKIIIVGAYAIGTHLAKLLSRNNNDIVLMDDDEQRLETIGRDFDLLTYNASPTSINALKGAGTENADLFIAVTPYESMNINVCILAKALGSKKTVAKVDSNEYMTADVGDFFKRLGVDSLIYPEMLAAIDINNGLKMSWVRQSWDVHDGALVMLSIKLRQECTILNKPLKDFCGADDPYHIVAIKRGNETIIPNGYDELKLYDMAYFMTTRSYIPYIRQIVGKEHYDDVKNVMIMGGGATSLRAVSTMPSYLNVKIIEQDPVRCEHLNELLSSDVMVINGDGRDLSLLTEEGIRNTQAFVALTGNAETNILACLTAKRFGVRKTVAMVENTDYLSMAESLDIGTLINKKLIAASNIYQMMLDADVDNVRFLMSANADVAEITAKVGSKVTKKKVFELGMPRGITFGGLVRNGVGYLISGGTQIQAGDSVVAFCHGVDIKKLEKYFN
jgi:trk system potassium uptake protein TrkA